MRAPPPPPPPRETDDQRRPSAKAKRAWSKPTVRKMTYVNIAGSGPTAAPGSPEDPKYRDTTS